MQTGSCGSRKETAEAIGPATRNSQGSSHTHKTDDFEPRTAPFSGAAYNALLP